MKILAPALLTLLGIAAPGAGHAQDAPAEEHAHAAGARLLVSDADSSTVSVLDLATGRLLASFSTPGEAGSVYASPGGQYGLVLHQGENHVSVIHSGLSLEDHGDHADLVQGAPHVLHTLNVGREPTHYWAHGDEMVIFNDADGTVALLDERSFGLSLDFAKVRAAQPDHSAAVVLGDGVLGDTLLVGYYELGQVDAYRRGGELLATFGGCPGLHGEATLQNTAAFGCEDGVLLVRAHEGKVSATKVSNPAGTAGDVRVGTLAAHDSAGVFVGNLGDGLAWIDPEAGTMAVVETSSAPLRFAFDHEGKHVLALTDDGLLHLLGADTGETHDTLRVMQALDTSGGHGSRVTPSLAVAEGAAYVSVPATGQIAEVHLDDFTVARSMDVPGTPSGVAVLSLEGGTVH